MGHGCFLIVGINCVFAYNWLFFFLFFLFFFGFRANWPCGTVDMLILYVPSTLLFVNLGIKYCCSLYLGNLYRVWELISFLLNGQMGHGCFLFLTSKLSYLIFVYSWSVTCTFSWISSALFDSIRNSIYSLI